MMLFKVPVERKHLEEVKKSAVAPAAAVKVVPVEVEAAEKEVEGTFVLFTETSEDYYINPIGAWPNFQFLATRNCLD